MDDINLKGWTRAEFLKEFENLPSDEDSIVNGELDNQWYEGEFNCTVEVEDNMQQDDIVYAFVEDSESDGSEWNVPLNKIRDIQKQLQYDADPIWCQTNNIMEPPGFDQYSGVTRVVQEIQAPSPYKLFRLLFEADIINNIVFLTNLYQDYHIRVRIF
ncbi:uncharacterized protein LOC108912036 [Anoplophora glabripennis]|uniref:uncharacterized protein LOC108912036 n=1 Tax=Anoplophora glabripennis TaxID=217634 RepID=UPI00087496B5|nr:uncharacterized protein LOC108912036 [Anoplophora glabripennis]